MFYLQVKLGLGRGNLETKFLKMQIKNYLLSKTFFFFDTTVLYACRNVNYLCYLFLFIYLLKLFIYNIFIQMIHLLFTKFICLIFIYKY